MRKALLAYIVAPPTAGIIVGVGTWALSDDDAISFVAALVSVLVVMAVELHIGNELRQSNLIKAIGLSKQITDMKEVGELVNSFQLVSRTGTKFERRMATERVATCSAALVGLNGGRCDIPADEVYPRSIQLVQEAKGQIFATSVIENHVFWGTEPGRDYWRACREAVAERGVEMTRVFMPKNVDDLDSTAKNLIRAQMEAGVDVKIVFTESLEKQGQGALIADFAIFDDRCALALRFQLESRSSITSASYCRSGSEQLVGLQNSRKQFLLHAVSADHYVTRTEQHGFIRKLIARLTSLFGKGS